jgi:phosphoribosyl 1,2-cyclic phosphodiesterase
MPLREIMSRMDQIRSGNRLSVECWGVRGSVPTPDKDKQELGGNTPCIVVRYNNEPVVIIDGGTGLRTLGTRMCEADTQSVRACLLFSHFHWDHIQGIPFFGPIYSERGDLKFYSTRRAGQLRQILEEQMKEPYFPVPMSETPSHREYGQVTPEGCNIGSLAVRPIRLNHPGGASGYRIDSPAGSIAYLSDHEHGIPDIDEKIVEESRGADLIIFDAQYTPAEYPRYRGWGHSTWLEGTRFANLAGAGQLLLFHHSPNRRDQEVSEILIAARKEFRATEFARENQSIMLARELSPVKRVVDL